MNHRVGPVAVLFAVLALASCASSGSDDAAPEPDTEHSTPTTPADTPTTVAGDAIDERFDIGGGQELYLECQGEGSPTILLEAGDESGREDWADVMPSLVMA